MTEDKQQMKHFIIDLYLLLGAYEDRKTKKIKLWYLWLGGIGGVFCRIREFFMGNILLQEWILCLLPGIFFLIFAKKDSEKIGDGDGWLLIVLGNCFSGKQLLCLFYLSVLLSAVYSFLLLLMKRADRKTQIPYLPFLWLSDIILWGLEYVR